jgi:dolichol-phosphate mannosyltransferase
MNQIGPVGQAEAKLISIVVPTHNERENVGELFSRLKLVFEGRSEKFELIFVDDSTDDTPDIVRSMHESDPRVKLIRLSRSFGQAMAITVGLGRAAGDAAIMMDADLQDPPEAIPQLLEEWYKGAKLVYVERRSVHNSPIYVGIAFLYYRALRFISETPIPPDAGEFRLLDRKLVHFMTSLHEHTRFIRGLSVWPGFKSAKVSIKREKRQRGETNYNFARSMAVALDGIFSFSTKPLRAAAVLGFGMSILSFLIGTVAVVARLFGQFWPSGAVAVLTALLMIGGIQFIFIGILGEYVGRIFVEVQRRPLFVIDYECGFESEAQDKNKVKPETF